MNIITLFFKTLNFLFLVFETTENGDCILEKVCPPLADLIWMDFEFG